MDNAQNTAFLELEAQALYAKYKRLTNSLKELRKDKNSSADEISKLQKECIQAYLKWKAKVNEFISSKPFLDRLQHRLQSFKKENSVLEVFILLLIILPIIIGVSCGGFFIFLLLRAGFNYLASNVF